MAETSAYKPPELRNCVVLVAGATRGVGRGIALAFGEAGATVYCTGRSSRAAPASGTTPLSGEQREKALPATYYTGRLETIYSDPHSGNSRLFLHYGDLGDASALARLIAKSAHRATRWIAPSATHQP